MEILSLNSDAEESSGSFEFEEVDFVPELFKDPELKVTQSPHFRERLCQCFGVRVFAID
jgi:hypothetical protein